MKQEYVDLIPEWTPPPPTGDGLALTTAKRDLSTVRAEIKTLEAGLSDMSEKDKPCAVVRLRKMRRQRDELLVQVDAGRIVWLKERRKQASQAVEISLQILDDSNRELERLGD